MRACLLRIRLMDPRGTHALAQHMLEDVAKMLSFLLPNPACVSSSLPDAMMQLVSQVASEQKPAM